MLWLLFTSSLSNMTSETKSVIAWLTDMKSLMFLKFWLVSLEKVVKKTDTSDDAAKTFENYKDEPVEEGADWFAGVDDSDTTGEAVVEGL